MRPEPYDSFFAASGFVPATCWTSTLLTANIYQLVYSGGNWDWLQMVDTTTECCDSVPQKVLTLCHRECCDTVPQSVALYQRECCDTVPQSVSQCFFILQEPSFYVTPLHAYFLDLDVIAFANMPLALYCRWAHYFPIRPCRAVQYNTSDSTENHCYVAPVKRCPSATGYIQTGFPSVMGRPSCRCLYVLANRVYG